MSTKILWTGNEVKAYVDNETGFITTDTTNIKGRLSQAETNITNLTTDVNANTQHISDLTTSVNGHTTNIANLTSDLASVRTLAEGRNKAITFDTIANANTGIKALAKGDLKVGDNVYILAEDVPDWYVYQVLETKSNGSLPIIGDFANTYDVGFFKLAKLETEKVDLINYYTKTQANSVIDTKITGSQNTQNTNIAYTYAKKTDALSSIAYDNDTRVLSQTKVGGATTNIATPLAKYSDTLSAIAFSGNTLTLTRGDNTTLTQSLASLVVPSATNSTQGKVYLFKETQWSTTNNTNDTASITAKFAGKIIANYKTSTLDPLYATKTELRTLNDSVQANLSAIQSLQGASITVSFEDGLTVEGIMNIVVPD